MSTEPKIADYTTRAAYQSNYSRIHREAINKRKRLWRKLHKIVDAVAHTMEQQHEEDR